MLVFLGIFILAFTGSVWNVPCDTDCECSSSERSHGKSRGHTTPLTPDCKCGPNEVYVDCASPCPPTCEEPNLLCLVLCTSPGCECKFGYIRDKHGNCIKPSDCPGGAPKCPANETYTPCKSACDLNMTTAYCPGEQCYPPDPVDLHPCIPGCVCLDDYLRRKEDGQCVYRYDCPPESTTEDCETTTPITTTTVC